MSEITKERKEYLLNNLLLFMKNEMEAVGATIDNYWFMEEFPEQEYYLGSHKPQLKQASEDTAKFIAKCPCEKWELDIAIKYGIAHDFLTVKIVPNKYRITRSGMLEAENYEEYIEKCVTDNQIILNDYIESTDNKVNEMLVKSRSLYFTKDLDGALEKIWDAFERIKTIYPDSNKKESAKKVCDACATSLDSDYINNEFKTLSTIGNDYQIRHFETDKKSISDINTKVYLYFRMLSLIIFVIKQMKVMKNDL